MSADEVPVYLRPLEAAPEGVLAPTSRTAEGFQTLVTNFKQHMRKFELAALQGMDQLMRSTEFCPTRFQEVATKEHYKKMKAWLNEKVAEYIAIISPDVLNRRNMPEDLDKNKFYPFFQVVLAPYKRMVKAKFWCLSVMFVVGLPNENVAVKLVGGEVYWNNQNKYAPYAFPIDAWFYTDMDFTNFEMLIENVSIINDLKAGSATEHRTAASHERYYVVQMLDVAITLTLLRRGKLHMLVCDTKERELALTSLGLIHPATPPERPEASPKGVQTSIRPGFCVGVDATYFEDFKKQFLEVFEDMETLRDATISLQSLALALGGPPSNQPPASASGL